jgi:hypothetical protein
MVVCSSTDAEIEELLKPGGVDLSDLSRLEHGTRFKRVRRFFTEGHLFDVKYRPSELLLISVLFQS